MIARCHLTTGKNEKNGKRRYKYEISFTSSENMRLEKGEINSVVHVATKIRLKDNIQKCLICELTGPLRYMGLKPWTFMGFSLHLKKTHNVDVRDYYLKFISQDNKCL